MKTKTYILGLVTTWLVFLGTLFKIQHWPGAGYLLILGIFMLVFVFLPAALMNNYRSEENRGNRALYVVTWITCFVVFTAMLFKVQHWPGAGYLLVVAIPFPFVVLLPAWLIVTGKNKNHNIYNTVAVLFLLALISAFTALMSLNVSKEMMADSLLVPGSYNRADQAISTVINTGNQTPLAGKIDKAVELLDEYEGLIFVNEGVTRDQWINDPEVLMGSSARLSAPRTFKGREGEVHGELQAALSDIITMVKNDPSNKLLAGNIEAILNMEHSRGEGYIWTDALFKSDVRPWVHAYLDGLRVNLKMIRATL